MNPIINPRYRSHRNTQMKLRAFPSSRNNSNNTVDAAEACISFEVRRVIHLQQQGKPDNVCHLPPENRRYFEPLATFLESPSSEVCVSNMLSRVALIDPDIFELKKFLSDFASDASKAAVEKKSGRLNLSVKIYLRSDMDMDIDINEVSDEVSDEDTDE